jgi:two-component system response regulator NreC
MNNEILHNKIYLRKNHLPFNLYHIVLVEDHSLVRRGIRRIIEENPELQIIGECGDGVELLQLLQTAAPQMVILDISMPRMGGIEATRRLKAHCPGIRVLVLTMHKDKEYLHQAMAAGAQGYLLKEDMDTELHTAIATLRSGRTYLSPLLSPEQ